MFICSLKIKSVGHVIKYYDTLFHYDIISDILLMSIIYVELDPSAHIKCIKFLS